MVAASNYEHVRNLVLGLSADEQAKIKAELDGQPNFSLEDLINFKANTGIKCPHCDNVEFIKNGTRNGVQRYICTSCKKSFNSLSQSFLSRTHKDFETWKSYAHCLSEGYSLRKAAKYCGISLLSNCKNKDMNIWCFQNGSGYGANSTRSHLFRRRGTYFKQHCE